MKKVILTGCSGFIGYHVTKKLIETGHHVLGIDSNNSYYSVDLKKSRLSDLQSHKNFNFIEADISSINFKSINFNADVFINLAAQAGVRYSLINPKSYVDSNIVGYFNVLDFCKSENIKLIYASSSSVYGENENQLSLEDNQATDQKSFYALTKKIGEQIAEMYSQNYDFNSIGLRFFTVYGPYGRPDMSYWKFTDCLLNDKEIEIYGSLDISRDFTYISDVVDCILKLIYRDISTNELFNITCGKNRTLGQMIDLLEKLTEKKALINVTGRQIGDVHRISASNEKIREYIDFTPEISMEKGMSQFVRWFKTYYNT